MKKIVNQLFGELILEAEDNPSWTAEQALRCARKELLEILDGKKQPHGGEITAAPNVPRYIPYLKILSDLVGCGALEYEEQTTPVGTVIRWKANVFPVQARGKPE